MTTMEPSQQAILERLAELPEGCTSRELYLELTNRGVELQSADFELILLMQSGLLELQPGTNPKYPICSITEAGRAALREQE